MPQEHLLLFFMAGVFAAYKSLKAKRQPSEPQTGM